jgi:hypothetical protein
MPVAIFGVLPRIRQAGRGGMARAALPPERSRSGSVKYRRFNEEVCHENGRNHNECNTHHRAKVTYMPEH